MPGGKILKMSKLIWTDKQSEINSYARFKTNFKNEKLHSDSAIKISADTEYALYLNGRFVDCGQYDDYPFDKIYDETDISKFLRIGDNELCIDVYYQGTSSFQYAVGNPGLWFEVIRDGKVVCESGEDVLSCPISAYKFGKMPLITCQLGYTYEYDARISLGEFSKSFEYESTPNMRPRPIKKCTLKKEDAALKTQGIFLRNEEGDFLCHKNADEIFENGRIKAENTYFLYDFGMEKTGYFEMELDAAEGAVIDIMFGEHLDDLRVRAHIGGRKFENRYICRGGVQKFFYPFKRIAGRYIELHVLGKINKIHSVSVVSAEYPLKDITLKEEDFFMEKLNSISKYTLKMCMHEHYEDCPWREQALYGSDSRNQMLFGYYAFGEFEFARACLYLLGEGLMEDGHLRICSPSDSTKRIPCFTFIWIHAILEYIEYSNDIPFAQRMAEKVREAIEKNTQNITDKGAVYPKNDDIWNFYEWSFGCDNEGIEFRYDNIEFDALHNVYLYMAIVSAAKIMKLCKDEKTEEKYARIAEKIKEIINKEFWCEEKGVYAAYIVNGEKVQFCELMQAMALYTGVAEEKEEKLAEILKSENDLIPITLANIVYKYDALMKINKNNLNYILDDMKKIWGKMVFAGATTFWETEKGAADFDNAGSLCHGWSALPIYITQRYLHNISAEQIRKLHDGSAC